MAEYIKGIIFFLIFISFIGIILPEGKYKKYINLVLGFVVMALVLRPMSDLGGIVGNISAQLSQTTVIDSLMSEENIETLIAEAVRAKISEQLSLAVDGLGYQLIGLDADVDVESGELRSITMLLTDTQAQSEIIIAPITLFTEAEEPVNDIKKIVSDFYQLPEEHIHVIIQ